MRSIKINTFLYAETQFEGSNLKFVKTFCPNSNLDNFLSAYKTGFNLLYC